MDIKELIEYDKDLTGYTTFGIPAKARMFVEYKSVKELDRLSRTTEFIDSELLHIGEGSNLLFVSDYSGMVLHSAIRGITRYDKDADTVYAIVGAGERMEDVIEWAIAEGLSGLENLSGIPGEAGASAVQNVGAYGVEAGELIHSVECFDLESRQTVKFSGEECRFSYRDSRFKGEWKGRYIILRVAFRLDPTGEARHLEYGQLKSLAERLGHTPTPAEVREEILKIRASKLPDPKEIGSAGSFFKNPVISRYYFTEEVLPFDAEMPYYEVGEHLVKVPAGWLIEHAGLKGYAIGGAYVYPDNCLVIANDGTATADDVVKLSAYIRKEVRRRFKIELEPEVNFIDTTVRVTVLGSGTSKGVPEIGCRCEVCRSEDPRDKRRRASVLVSTHGMNILIDVSPDFRQQALDEGISDISAVLLTHSHYDHVGGMDDLRPMCAFHNVPIYLRQDVNDDLHRRLDYCFKPHPYPGVPSFDMHVIENRPFEINGLTIVPIEVMHGKLPIFGYRIGDFAYITDAHTIDEWELDKLEGVDTLIINALRYKPHFSHLSIDEALEIIDKVKPREAYLTHLCHDAPRHEELEARLPENVHVAYDGLKILVK